MGLENRNNGHSYFYRKRRTGSKVVSVYEGSGLTAELLALEAQLEADEKGKKRAAFEREKRKFESIDSLVDISCESGRLVLTALYLANGYHMHQRTWRRRRDAAEV